MTSPYAYQQLGRALVTAATHESATTRRAAERRVRAWASVLEGAAAGRITVGSRTPVAGLPVWVTPEVVRGGFATGRAAADGPLEADEIARADRLGLPRDRAAVFASYLTDDGLAELENLFTAGTYEVRIPEDAVLLVVGHLSARGDRTAALGLLESVRPFVGDLRFVPRVAPARQTPAGQVSRETADEVRQNLEHAKIQRRVETQREAIEVWQPLTDRFTALWWSARTGWTDEHGGTARLLLDEYRLALTRNQLCWKKSRGDGETLPRLVRATQARLDDRLTEPARNGVERLLQQIVAKRGEPGSDALRRLRATQAHIAAQPSHRDIARVAADRCSKLPGAEGISDVDAVLEPVTTTEAERFGVPHQSLMPNSVHRKVRLGTVGSLTSLIGKGVVPSAEVVAELLPALTGEQIATGYDTAGCGRLVSAVYEAFRRRRSLLLFDLERQVQFDELPWVSVLDRYAVTPGAQRTAVLARQVTAAAIDAWPGTILPNTLVRELVTLYEKAGTPLPLVPEVAADIFEGRFAPRFSQAAREAAGMLRGTVYERYYGLDLGALLAADPSEKSLRRKVFGKSKTLGEVFDEMCQVPPSPVWSVARNGMVIERQQVLTTQNLAVLTGPGGVRPGRDWFDLAVAAAGHCARLLRRAQTQEQPLATVKDAAYAWRQALFFLVRADGDEGDFVRAVSPGATWPMTEVLDGLTPGSEARRLLGWTVTRHWAVARR